MKKEEYLKAIQKITPDEQAKNAVWQSVKNSVDQKESAIKKREKNVWKRGYLYAAAMVCILLVSAPMVASGINSLILQENTLYHPVGEKIETGIFVKSDEHVQVSVEELLTDGMIAHMTVKYTALDRTGQKWLDDLVVSTERGDFLLSLKAYMENTIEFGTNFSYGATELEEYAKETERWYYVTMESSSRDYSEGKGIFTFPLTESVEKEVLDISGNIEIRQYKLSADEQVSEYYIPTCIELSPLSFVIYAKNTGTYERKQQGDYTEEKWLLPDEEIDELEDNSYFIMKDGSREKLPAGVHNTTYPKERNMESDLVLYSGKFYEDADAFLGNPKTMDLDEIEAIVINGVHFIFDK